MSRQASSLQTKADIKFVKGDFSLMSDEEIAADAVIANGF